MLQRVLFKSRKQIIINLEQVLESVFPHFVTLKQGTSGLFDLNLYDTSDRLEIKVFRGSKESRGYAEIWK